MSTIEFTEQKSKDLALQIELIKAQIQGIDLDYLEGCCIEFKHRALIQSAASPISRSYDFKKSELLQEQSRSMQCLLDFIDSLKKCDELKRAVERNKLAANNIENLFL